MRVHLHQAPSKQGMMNREGTHSAKEAVQQQACGGRRMAKCGVIPIFVPLSYTCSYSSCAGTVPYLVGCSPLQSNACPSHETPFFFPSFRLIDDMANPAVFIV